MAIGRRQARGSRHTPEDIAMAVSRTAGEYGYGNVWLFGDYCVGIYGEGCLVQVMLDSSDDPGNPLRFAAGPSCLSREWPRSSDPDVHARLESIQSTRRWIVSRIASAFLWHESRGGGGADASGYP